MKMNIERAHSVLSASGADLWLLCSGGVKANQIWLKKHGETPEEEYTKSGTRAHKLGYRCLSEGLKADSLIGEIIDGEAVDTEMAGYVQQYVDYVKSYDVTNEVKVECKVDYSHLVPTGFGTFDGSWFDKETGVYHIFDGKFGRGIKVSAIKNNQLRLYALGIYKEFGLSLPIDGFCLHVIQPRIGNYSDWSLSVSELMAFGEYASERADLAMTDDAPRTPGILQCQWCNVKGDCNALAKMTESTLNVDFDSLVNFTEPDINSLSDERKKAILDNMPLMSSFFKNVQSSVFFHVSGGGTFKGYKTVLGKSIRVWKDTSIPTLEALLGDDAYNKKIIGVTAAQKALGKKVVDDLTKKTEPKLTLVDDSDKRTSTNDNPFK